jgi:hypothetical protein
VPAIQQSIDDAAREVGRDPLAIRRGYNLMGAIVQPGSRPMVARRKGIIIGTARHWVDEIVRYYSELKMDTFIFWPVLGNEVEKQAQVFAEEVIPAVIEVISQ